MTDRLVEKAGAALEGRTSRRGLLARAALVGSALSVSPLRYLLRPTTAWGVISPGGCSHGLCNDGYTAFCCEINHGSNTCPPHTYTAVTANPWYWRRRAMLAPMRPTPTKAMVEFM